MTPEDREYFDDKFEKIRYNMYLLNTNLEMVFDAVLYIKHNMKKSDISELIDRYVSKGDQ